MNLSNIASHIRYSVLRECPATGWKLNARTIPDNEFVLITSGKGFAAIGGKEYTLKPGMLLYFYPGLVHSMESCTDNPMSFYGLHFSIASIEYMNNKWKVEEDISTLTLPAIMEMKNYPILSDLMKKLHYYFIKNENDSRLMCSGLFSQLLYCIFQDFKQNGFNYSSRKKIEAAMGYIAENLGRKISANGIAAKLDMSSDYLSVLFKNYTGYTLTRYINQCRIDSAKLLLIEENGRIKDVAARTGFCDEFYFSRVFKRLEGISPAQFCEKARNTGA